MPPALKISARPLTPRTQRKWSRAAPAFIRRGPDRLQARTPPKVARQAMEGGKAKSSAQSGGSKASICRLDARTASISASGVAAPAVMTSSVGWYSRIPVSPDRSSVCGNWRGRPSARFVVPILKNISDKGYTVSQGSQQWRGQINSISNLFNALDIDYRSSLYHHSELHYSKDNIDKSWNDEILTTKHFSFRNIHQNLDNIKW